MSEILPLSSLSSSGLPLLAWHGVSSWALVSNFGPGRPHMSERFAEDLGPTFFLLVRGEKETSVEDSGVRNISRGVLKSFAKDIVSSSEQNVRAYLSQKIGVSMCIQEGVTHMAGQVPLAVHIPAGHDQASRWVHFTTYGRWMVGTQLSPHPIAIDVGTSSSSNWVWRTTRISRVNRFEW